MSKKSSSSSSQGWGQKIYSGAATVGRPLAIYNAFIATIISIAIIIFGVYAIRKKDEHPNSIVAKIIGPVVCTPYVDQNHNQDWHCTLPVEYTVGNQTIQKSLSSSGSTDYEGYKTVTVYYNPANPADAVLTKFPWHMVGWIALIAGIVIVVSTWIWAILAMYYKPVAAFTTGEQVMGMFLGRH